jgi:fatty acyl-CoA reductase
MVRLQHKIQDGLELLQYFTTRKWNFRSAKFCALRGELSPADRETFFADFEAFDEDEYLVTAVLGARQYCLKEPLSSLPRCRRNIKMYVASSQPKPFKVK